MGKYRFKQGDTILEGKLEDGRLEAKAREIDTNIPFFWVSNELERAVEELLDYIAAKEGDLKKLGKYKIEREK